MTLHSFDAGALGAVIALIRALDQRSPVAARRAAVRAAIVHECAEAMALEPAERALCLTTTLLADAGLVSSTVAIADPVDSAASGAMLLVGCPGLDAAAISVFHQHERVDGGGQPYGLVGEDIPLAARLHAVADSLTQWLSEPHEVLPWADAITHMKELAGTRLDLRLTDVCYHATLTPAVRDRIEATAPPGAIALLSTAMGRAVATTSAPPTAEEPGADWMTRARQLIRSLPRVTEVIEVLAGEALRSLGATGIGVGRIDQASQSLAPVATAGDLPPSLRTLPLHPRLVDPDTARCGVVEVDAGPVGHVLATTVPGMEGPWGVVWAVSPADHERVATDLVTFAHAVADAVAQGAHIGRLVDAASLDALTQVLNRRSLDHHLDELFARHEDDRADAALVMCDIDGLKLVNDTDGHGAGDAVLVTAAAALRRLAGEYTGATVFRLGGDEFCILVPRGGLLAGEDLARAADDAVRAATGGQVSASCGVGYGIQADTPADLLRRADEAQYVVKRSRTGRAHVTDTEGGRGRRILRDA